MKKLTEITSGLMFIVFGIIGLIFSTTTDGIKKRPVKIAAISLSILSIVAGLYLFASGLTKESAGQLNDQGEVILENVFASKADFKEKLIRYKNYKNAHKKNVRRLKFQCVDKSNDFTIYLTSLGIFNIPEKSITCIDGQRLLVYTGN